MQCEDGLDISKPRYSETSIWISLLKGANVIDNAFLSFGFVVDFVCKWSYEERDILYDRKTLTNSVYIC